MKKFFKNNWGRIILFVMLILICALSFTKGKYLLGNDNYSPELNPVLTIERSLESPAWRSYRVLGFGSESEQADVFRAVFYLVAEKVLPRDSLGQVFGLLCLFTGSWFIGELACTLSKGSKLKKYNQTVFLLTGVFYFTTLWTVWIYYQNLAPFTSNFGFLPLLLFSMYVYINDPSKRNSLFLFLSSVVFTSSCVIATLFVSDFPLIFFFILFFCISLKERKKEKIYRIFKTFLIFGLTQLFWILPFIFYTFSSSGDLVDSYINRSITSSIIDLESGMQTAVNSARFFTRILTEMRNGEYLFPLSLDFQTYDFYKVIGLLPVLGVFLCIVFSAAKKNWKLLFFPVCAFFSWFLIKGSNPPFGEVFTFLQENIPLFEQVFRWVSSKIGEVYLVSLSISCGFGFVLFFDFVQSFLKKRFKKVVGIMLLILVAALQLFYANYLFTNDLFSDEFLVEVPQEYYDLNEYLEENELSGRIYYAPPSNDNYFREYDWGFYGSQFISYIVSNPIMDMSLAVGSGAGEEAMLEIQNVFRAGDYEEFNSLMDRYGVEYVLVDRSLVEDGFTYDIDWEVVDSLIGNYDLLWSEGSLELYSVNKEEDTLLLEYLGDESEYIGNVFSREDSVETSIDFLSLDLENLSINNSIITGTYTYSGEDSSVVSNIENTNWQELPVGLRIEDSNLIIYPVFLSFSDYFTQTPEKVYDISGYDYVTVNGNTFTISKLEEGVYLDDSFGSDFEVYGATEGDFKTYDLTNTLGQNTGYNCKDEDMVEDIEVLVQKGSSGFSLSGKNTPCVYEPLILTDNSEYAFRVDLNWEASRDNLLGFCLYSEKKEKCLNNDKYIYTDKLADEKTILITEGSEKGDTISLIIYSLNVSGSEDSEIYVRRASVEYISLGEEILQKEYSNVWEYDELKLKDGEKYLVEIPILDGDQSYYFDGEEDTFVWEPSSAEDGSLLYEISSENGMVQDVLGQTLVQSTNLFVTNPLEEYILFWDGENISNIPGEICLSYKDSGECWFEDLFTENIYMGKVESSSVSNRLDVLYESLSYNKETENILKNFGIMKIPDTWKNIQMNSLVNMYYGEFEMESLYNSSSSTMYKISSKDVTYQNSLISIPQKMSSGWLAIAESNGRYELISSKVTINGWKQGWDISNLEYDNIYVIYWPNLLGYLGYVLILTEGIYLTVNLFKKKKHESK